MSNDFTYSKPLKLARPVIRFVAMNSGNWTKTLYKKSTQVRRAVERIDRTNNPNDWFDIIQELPHQRSMQKKWEIVRFLKMIMNIQIRYACEIGTDTGGTLILFMRASLPDATFISIDLKNTVQDRLALRFAKQPNQKLYLLQQNSQDMQTLLKVKKILRGNMLDFLFIDGDHAYESVRRDYELYSMLVREGGIIGFHDIMPDRFTTDGVKTNSRAGDVHQYWQETKNTFRTEELVESRDQDGFGIGIVYK